MRAGLVSMVLLVGVLTPLMAQEREVINAPGIPEGLPFSSAVRVDDTIYLSGQIGLDPETGALAPGGIGPETRQAMENIEGVLAYAGSSLDDVVKCSVFLLDIDDYSRMNEVYASFFPENPPARSTFATSGLALGSRVEIECLAVRTRT